MFGLQKVTTDGRRSEVGRPIIVGGQDGVMRLSMVKKFSCRVGFAKITHNCHLLHSFVSLLCRYILNVLVWNTVCL